MADLFTFRDVSLAVGGTSILDRIELDLPGDGITFVVGPSGSGKSSLLRLCNGLERPSTGEIRYRNTPLDEIDIRAHRRRVGMVFQRPTVFEGSGFDNLVVADPSLDRAGAAAALQRVGLGGELLDRAADDLSGGEAQRLCLARTLLTDPEVVLMDEPTSALDIDSVHQIEHLVGDLAAAGVRFVWVSHDRDQVRRMSTWIVRVEGGRVVESGPSTAMGHVHLEAGLWQTADPPPASGPGEEHHGG